jgi:hypothetical protein
VVRGAGHEEDLAFLDGYFRNLDASGSINGLAERKYIVLASHAFLQGKSRIESQNLL